jgi:hypothetical protein
MSQGTYTVNPTVWKPCLVGRHDPGLGKTEVMSDPWYSARCLLHDPGEGLY